MGANNKISKMIEIGLDVMSLVLLLCVVTVPTMLKERDQVKQNTIYFNGSHLQLCDVANIE